MDFGTQAQKHVWEGAIPLQIHLHESEVTTLPPPPPALILGPRIGYLPLLVPLIKPHFSNTLPPGVDTVWFEYKGLPLKWYIPTGVLFDLLCLEPERPWNLTVHFRGYPANLLSPCEGEDSVKGSFNNSLKEAAYVINGNCKNVMNMSQSDQVDLWRSVVNGNMEGYLRISSKLKLGIIGEEHKIKLTQPRQSKDETDIAGPSRTGRVPVRLYVQNIMEDLDELEDASPVNSWDNILYINRPVVIHEEEGKDFTLHDAIKTLLPEFFTDELTDEQITAIDPEDEQSNTETNLSHCNEENARSRKSGEAEETSDKRNQESCSPNKAEIKLIRVQGIEPKLEIPFSWVVNNLMNPEHFLHICVVVKLPPDQVNRMMM
ncbi:autophagy protein 5 isoform X1 [Telopea speciosissima]|uniref:autophagy protein 5 isoform X1 n=1 Tax=Telopea speciosissima TaxID=54955 RepID=UPI001CC5D3FD|nr:autophagy protein 5 isoform X1 [Telopea speciosissima]